MKLAEPIKLSRNPGEWGTRSVVAGTVSVILLLNRLRESELGMTLPGESRAEYVCSAVEGCGVK
jgi:hypothetical protein